MDRRFTAASASRFAILLTVCGALLLLIGALTVRYIVVDLPAMVAQRTMHGAADTAREIATQVAAAFQVQPKVVLGGRILVAQRSEVLKLVTLEQSLTERQRLDESWLHSTKTLEIEGDFVIRAGFDLAKPFVVEIDESSGVLRVTLPPAEILATDLQDVRFLHDEDGLWNRLTADDRERALRDLRLRVARRAAESDLRDRARASAEKRLTDLLSRDGHTVTFQTGKRSKAP
ncbi:MAG: DUF4230 domain-containing protein [Terrimicrobiaceae bacterium]|nr:DUF4230 domain-containing protein [Terrimicrobiaceae bacterium]